MRTSVCTRIVLSLSHPYPARPIISHLYPQYRSFSSGQRLSNEDASGEDGGFKRSKRVKVDPQTVSSWFRDEGLPYLHPTPGKTNWLGGDIPFPDNPTFQPPPPLSDAVKSSIYGRYLQFFQLSAFKSDSHKKAVRSLSEQFGISIARVEAIIRLKEYQRQYEKGKKLQYAFQRGMESYLGIKLEREKALASSSEPRPIEINFARQRAAEVDSEVFEAAKGDQKKSGAARKVWWEMTDDAPDAEPIVPSLIAKELEERRNKLSEDQEAHAGIAKRVDGPNPLPGKPRSVFTFIDTSVKKPAKKVRA